MGDSKRVAEIISVAPSTRRRKTQCGKEKRLEKRQNTNG
jgi:hypothetical protein